VLDDDGRVSFTALLGLISVVANTKNTNNKNIRSVIDDAEKLESILELLLIAIAQLFYRLVQDIHKRNCCSLHAEHHLLDTCHEVVVGKVGRDTHDKTTYGSHHRYIHTLRELSKLDAAIRV
jgi:hypothetical protein